jgi:hypothetical protein
MRCVIERGGGVFFLATNSTCVAQNMVCGGGELILVCVAGGIWPMADGTHCV